MVIGLGEHLTFGREILKMKITDHIGIFDNGVPHDLCTSIIESFNMWEGNREFV